MYGSDANHFPGGIAPYLSTAIDVMIESGFTEEEQCRVLTDTAF
jgi:hypothetical protein